MRKLLSVVAVVFAGWAVANCGGGGGGSQDCDSLCQKLQASGCEQDFNMQECQAECNWGKANLQSAFFNESAKCLDQPCAQQAQCAENAMSKCVMPSNKDTVIDAYCAKSVECQESPDVNTCKTAIGTMMDVALMCLNSNGISTTSSCISGSTCEDFGNNTCF